VTVNNSVLIRWLESLYKIINVSSAPLLDWQTYWEKIDISLYLLRGNVLAVLMKLYFLKTDFFLDSFHENKRNPSIISHWPNLSRSLKYVKALIPTRSTSGDSAALS
jgi:hypothetical protein